jgi:hypothetical protein
LIQLKDEIEILQKESCPLVGVGRIRSFLGIAMLRR